MDLMSQVFTKVCNLNGEVIDYRVNYSELADAESQFNKILCEYSATIYAYKYVVITLVANNSIFEQEVLTNIK